MSQQQSRRRFITEVAGAAAALLPGLGCPQKKKAQNGGAATKAATGRAPPPASRPLEQQPKVIRVSCPRVNGSGPQVDRGLVRQMLERGLRELGGTDDARAALARWIRPVDTVGLKVNCLAGRQMSTHVELVEALVDLLQQTGLRRQQAVVFDRADRDLRWGGFPIREGGSDYLSLGNDRGGYEREVRVMPSGASRFSIIATQRASVLVNLPILKDHGIAGLSAALKNNFGLVHNPNKFHLNGCDPHVAEVNQVEPIRAKQRLVICDALRVQVDGGPAFHAAAADSHGALLLATDPVALDVIAWEVLESLRKKRKLPSLAEDRRKPVHVLTAGGRRLGVADRKRIRVIEVKVS